MLTPRSEGMAEVLVRLVEGNSVTAASYTGMPGFARLVLPSQTNDGRVCDSRPTGPRSLRSSINNVVCLSLPYCHQCQHFSVCNLFCANERLQWSDHSAILEREVEKTTSRCRLDHASHREVTPERELAVQF